ncbi:MAG: SPOR domain-containing protein, partial [Oscillospiraceae bacterium]|nr:SPOR domain-containing protein [Oscillospiraceae bacterium]
AIGEAIAKGVCDYFGVDYNLDENVSSDKIYRVQVGAFSVKSNAENCLQKAKSAGFTDAFITEVQR